MFDVLRDRGQTTVVVDRAAHKKFRQLRDGHFVLNPARETDFQRLFAAMGTQWLRGGPLKVVYFCNASRSGTAASVRDRYYDEIGDKIHALVLIMRSLARYGVMDAISLTIVTRGLRDVIGGERTDPMAALTLGPCLAAKYEYPGLETRIVDVSDNAAETDYLSQALAVDLASPPAEVVTVYRRNRRWVPMLEPIPTRVISPGAIALRTGGTYLITGGLGQIGLAVAKRLAQDYQARLVLIGRTSVPDRSLWDGILSDSAADERLAAIIRGIREIEACGGEVMIGQADAADLQQMRVVVRQADARFARLHGVVHAAGVPGSTPIGIKTPEQLDQVLRPKILGLANLEQLFAKRDLDFLLTFSSISALQGRAGQVDYIGANAYLIPARFRRAKLGTMADDHDQLGHLARDRHGRERRGRIRASRHRIEGADQRPEHRGGSAGILRQPGHRHPADCRHEARFRRRRPPASGPRSRQEVDTLRPGGGAA